MAVGLKVLNERELRQGFEQLKKSARNRIARKAVRAAQPPQRKSVRSLAPRRTGTLKKSIRSVVKTLRTGGAFAYVGARMDSPAHRYIHLVERGHALPGGGRVEGKHFLRQAADQSFPPSLQLLVSKVRVELPVETRKAFAKARAKSRRR